MTDLYFAILFVGFSKKGIKTAVSKTHVIRVREYMRYICIHIYTHTGIYSNDLYGRNCPPSLSLRYGAHLQKRKGGDGGQIQMEKDMVWSNLRDQKSRHTSMRVGDKTSRCLVYSSRDKRDEGSIFHGQAINFSEIFFKLIR